MWWKSPAKKTTKNHRIAEGGILDYSRVRVKPGMCRGLSKGCAGSSRSDALPRGRPRTSDGCPFHKLELHEIGELLVSENANGAETSNPRGVLETQ